MTLIDVSTLARALARELPPTVIDVRWRLGGPSCRHDYREGHIPGAAFVDLDGQVCGRPGPAGRHPLPEPAVFEEAMRAVGVRNDGPVVVYDGGEIQAAARLWWTLRWAGHTDVAVLDGGYAAWQAENRPIEPGTAAPRPGDFAVRVDQLPVLDANGAAAIASSGRLLDARVAPRFLGETEPIDPVAGHIPGAVNCPAAMLMRSDGRLLPPDDLMEVFATMGVGPGMPIGAYCGSGVTAAQTVLALHVAGLTDAALYVGSWSNWVADPKRPVAVGASTGPSQDSAG